MGKIPSCFCVKIPEEHVVAHETLGGCKQEIARVEASLRKAIQEISDVPLQDISIKRKRENEEIVFDIRIQSADDYSAIETLGSFVEALRFIVSLKVVGASMDGSTEDAVSITTHEQD